MESIIKELEVNGYLIETRAQHEVFRVFIVNQYGSLIRENYYTDAKKANACFNRFKKQISNY